MEESTPLTGKPSTTKETLSITTDTNIRKGRMTKQVLDDNAKANISKYLRGLREKQGLTQAELAKKIGLDPDKSRTVVTQCESGVIRIPPERMKDWAKAVKEPKDKFAEILLKYYNPEFYDCIFR